MDNTVSEVINAAIVDTIERSSGLERIEDKPLDALVGFAEILDRLTICNLKLFHIKNVQASNHDQEILAQSAKDDVRLVKERARLKAALDEKLVYVVNKALLGQIGNDGKEVKIYG